MSMTPIVAVTADVAEEDDGYRWHGTEDTYLRAVSVGAGAIPVIVPAIRSLIEIDSLLDRVDGVLVTGAKSNVHPSHYGEAAGERSGPFDPHRDEMNFALIRAAIARGKPILAICRGLQELNVALGGTLVGEIQDLPGRMDHRAPKVPANDDRFAIRQPVTLAAGGCLARIVGDEAIRVNSLHRQAIGRLAAGLTIEGTAPDGTIEAVSVPDAPAFAVGVQWHPEYWVESDPTSARIFRAFGDAVRARMAGATTALLADAERWQPAARTAGPR